MESDVEDRVVAMEAVVASSKDGGVQGRRSGRPAGGAGAVGTGAALPHLSLPPPAACLACSHPGPRPTCHPTLCSAPLL